jgi:hypothetical protein
MLIVCGADSSTGEDVSLASVELSPYDARYILSLMDWIIVCGGELPDLVDITFAVPMVTQLRFYGADALPYWVRLTGKTGVDPTLIEDDREARTRRPEHWSMYDEEIHIGRDFVHWTGWSAAVDNVETYPITRAMLETIAGIEVTTE